jgi:hypothetical protein
MSKNTLLISLLLGALILTTGCGQLTARKLGGTTTEQLPPNTKLVNVTWKENSLWLVTRPMRAEEQPETYEFKESAIFGLLEGKIVIKESR